MTLVCGGDSADTPGRLQIPGTGWNVLEDAGFAENPSLVLYFVFCFIPKKSGKDQREATSRSTVFLFLKTCN